MGSASGAAEGAVVRASGWGREGGRGRVRRARCEFRLQTPPRRSAECRGGGAGGRTGPGRLAAAGGPTLSH